MSMDARMTGSTADNQARVAGPKLTRHINKHTHNPCSHGDTNKN